MKRLNIFATAEEIAEIKSCLNAPVIAISNPAAPGPNVSPVIPLSRSPQEAAHRAALNHGLPDFSGYYGLDLQTGEFVEP